MNLRLSTVNAEIQRQGFDAELVKGEGYFYFLGPDVERAYSTMVNVTRLNQISLRTRGYGIEAVPWASNPMTPVQIRLPAPNKREQ